MTGLPLVHIVYHAFVEDPEACVRDFCRRPELEARDRVDVDVPRNAPPPWTCSRVHR